MSSGGVFALGLVISRLASIALLPAYTRFLTPADYGVMTILDLVQEVLRLALGSAFLASAGRLHFDSESEDRRARVWWVALLAVTGLTILVTAPLALLSPMMARLSFGPDFQGGAGLFSLMLVSLCFGLPELLLQAHLRTIKRASLLVGLSLARLAANATLNISLLYFLRLGVAAVLWGNLITAIVFLAVHLGIFVKVRGRVRVDLGLLPQIAHFGGPMIGVALISLAMHQIDRYFLVNYVSLTEVGLYSFAYAIGQGINSLVLYPFGQVWAVTVFDIARMRQSRRVFAEVFSAFVRGLTLVILAASLAAGPAVELLATPAYARAADFVPIIALAYLFFSLDDHFRVPALLQKRTSSMLPVYALTLGLNVALNAVLVPRWGAAGAAWATVFTFIGFSCFGLVRYRRIERIDYPLADALMVVGSAVAAFIAFEVVFRNSGFAAHAAGGIVIWAGLAAVYSIRPLRAWRQLEGSALAS